MTGPLVEPSKVVELRSRLSVEGREPWRPGPLQARPGGREHEHARPAVLVALGDAVLARVDDVAEQMVEEILATEVAYRDGVPVDDLRASCRRNAAQLLRKLTQPEAAAPEYLSFLTELARRRVGQGLPLDSLLHAYRVGARAVWTALVTEARHDGERLGALASAATLLWELHDSSSGRITAAYREAEHTQVRLTSERRFAMVDALLSRSSEEGAVRWRAASVLGLAHGGSNVVVVAELAHDPSRTLADLESRLSGHTVASVWRPLPAGLVGIVQTQAEATRHVVGLLAPMHLGRVGVSPAVEGLSQLPHARHLAEIALATVPLDACEVAVLDDRLPEALLVTTPDIAGLVVQHSLGAVLSLPEPERSDLLDVIEAFLANGQSVTATADALHYHRNTVIKRLRRVRAVTRRDPSNPDDGLAFALAVRALRLVRW